MKIDKKVQKLWKEKQDLYENKKSLGDQMKGQKECKQCNKELKFWLITGIQLLGFLILFYFIFYGYVYQHEKIHQVIFYENGIGSEIYITFGLEGKTIPQESCKTSECWFAQYQTEVIGYYFQYFLQLVCLGFLFWFVYSKTKKYQKIEEK
jgi:hypothetical protein